MSADARQWLAFADADLRAARLLLADVDVPSRLACFHAQQAAEKALKAALIAESTPFRKTHDIVVLAGLVPPSLSITLAALDLLVLQPWAVEGRYPGDMSDATDSEADEAVMIAIEVVAVVDRWMRGASAI